MKRSSFLALLVACTVIVVACERHRTVPPLTDDEIEELTEGQPRIFIKEQGTLTLEGIEDLYLGQPYDEAMAVLDEYCEVVKVYEGGWRRKDAVFKGCNIFDVDPPKTLRAGFWPFNDDRLSTLEIRQHPIPRDVVRARFTQLADHLNEDRPRRGILIMASTRYRLIASWDDGIDEPAHITIGLHPP